MKWLQRIPFSNLQWDDREVLTIQPSGKIRDKDSLGQIEYERIEVLGKFRVWCNGTWLSEEPKRFLGHCE